MPLRIYAPQARITGQGTAVLTTASSNVTPIIDQLTEYLGRELRAKDSKLPRQFWKVDDSRKWLRANVRATPLWSEKDKRETFVGGLNDKRLIIARGASWTNIDNMTIAFVPFTSARGQQITLQHGNTAVTWQFETLLRNVKVVAKPQSRSAGADPVEKFDMASLWTLFVEDVESLGLARSSSFRTSNTKSKVSVLFVVESDEERLQRRVRLQRQFASSHGGERDSPEYRLVSDVLKLFDADQIVCEPDQGDWTCEFDGVTGVLTVKGARVMHRTKWSGIAVIAYTLPVEEATETAIGRRALLSRGIHYDKSLMRAGRVIGTDWTFETPQLGSVKHIHFSKIQQSCVKRFGSHCNGFHQGKETVTMQFMPTFLAMTVTLHVSVIRRIVQLRGQHSTGNTALGVFFSPAFSLIVIMASQHQPMARTAGEIFQVLLTDEQRTANTIVTQLAHAMQDREHQRQGSTAAMQYTHWLTDQAPNWEGASVYGVASTDPKQKKQLFVSSARTEGKYILIARSVNLGHQAVVPTAASKGDKFELWNSQTRTQTTWTFLNHLHSVEVRGQHRAQYSPPHDGAVWSLQIADITKLGFKPFSRNPFSTKEPSKAATVMVLFVSS